MRALEILVYRHCMDAIEVACHLLSHEQSCSEQSPLLLAPGADESAALRLGLEPETNGLLTLIQKGEAQAIPDYECLQIASDWGRLGNCVETLAQVRKCLPESQSRTLCLISLDRIERDLPRLTAQDRISLAWSGHDMLSSTYLDFLEYTSERMEIEGPSFGGLILYDKIDDPSKERIEGVIEIVNQDIPIQHLTLTGGYPWQTTVSS